MSSLGNCFTQYVKFSIILAATLKNRNTILIFLKAKKIQLTLLFLAFFYNIQQVRSLIPSRLINNLSTHNIFIPCGLAYENFQSFISKK